MVIPGGGQELLGELIHTPHLLLRIPRDGRLLRLVWRFVQGARQHQRAMEARHLRKRSARREQDRGRKDKEVRCASCSTF